MAATLFDRMAFARTSVEGTPALKLATQLGLALRLLRPVTGDKIGLDQEWLKDPGAQLRLLAGTGPDADQMVDLLCSLFKPNREFEKTRLHLENRKSAGSKKRTFSVLNLDIRDDERSGICLSIDKTEDAGKNSYILSICIIEQFTHDLFTFSVMAWLPVIKLATDAPPSFLLTNGQSDGLEFRIDCLQGRDVDEAPMLSFGGAFHYGRRAFHRCALQTSRPGGDTLDIGFDTLNAVFQRIVGVGSGWLNEPLGSSSVTLGMVLEAGRLIEAEALPDPVPANELLYTLSATGSALVKRFAPGGMAAALPAAQPGQGPETVNWGAMLEKLGSAASDTLFTHPSSPLFRRGELYGARATLPDLALALGTDKDVAPSLILQLGKWLPSGVDKGAWLVEDGRANTPGIGNRAGIELALIEAKPLPGRRMPELAFARKPGIRLNAVGLDLMGGAKAPLIAVASLFTIQGLELRLYWDAQSGDFGLGGRVKGLKFLLDAGSVDKGNPAGQIMSNVKVPPNAAPPQFSVELSFIRKQFNIRLFDAADRPADVIWFPIQRDCGPLTISRLGFGLRKAGADWEISALVSGRLSFAGVQMELLEAGIGVRLNDLSTARPYLRGMSLSYKQGAIAIDGGFLQISDTVYAGQLSVRLPKVSLNVLGIYGTYKTPASPQPVTSLFVYGTLSFTGGAGIKMGAITITGFALGFGYNRRVIVPAIGEVANFPLVSLVMNDGKTSSGTVPSTGEVLSSLERHLPFEPGQMFAAFGVRFTIAEAVDAFALAIVQFGKDVEFTLLGLGRFEKAAGALKFCRVELAIKMTLRPADGVFLLQAELTGNSFVLDEKCRLTGGFALGIWFAGPRKGDFVLTLGGYHSKFKPPAHYPVVPRLGMNWAVMDGLTIKGELYCALTPSHMMAGGRLEAAFARGRIKAWFVAAVDFLMKWAPLEYELDAGIMVRIEADLPIKRLSLSADVTLRLQGPPFAGRADIQLSVLSVSIEFGGGRQVTKIENWGEFGALFLDKGSKNWGNVPDAGGTAVTGPAICAASLLGGRQTEPGEKEPSGPWRVRADELQLAVNSVLPATKLNFGTFGGTALPGTPAIQNLTIADPIRIAKADHAFSKDEAELGIVPLQARDLQSTLNITIVQEDATGTFKPVDLAGWNPVPEEQCMPAALWDHQQPDKAPGAKLTGACFTGLASCRPPAGTREGKGSIAAIDRLIQPTLQLPGGPDEREKPAARAERQHVAMGALLDAHRHSHGDLASKLGGLGFKLDLRAGPAAEAGEGVQRSAWARPLYAQPMTRTW